MEKTSEILSTLHNKNANSTAKRIRNAGSVTEAAESKKMANIPTVCVSDEPWPKGPIDDREGVRRWALRGLRKRGLRNLKKYPPEPWEPPLTEQERERFK
jgi:hypothetical protein